MAKHLTDREKKKIIADYAEMGSCNAVANKHKRSWTTVKQVVESDPDTMKKCEQKMAENMRDVLAWMDARKPYQRNVIRLRYIDGKTWRQVQKLTHYSKRATVAISKNARKSLQG